MKEVCELINYKTLKIGNLEFQAIERIRQFVEFENKVVIRINAKKEDPEIDLKYEGGNVFCIDKETAKVIWQSELWCTNLWRTRKDDIVMVFEPTGYDVILDLATGSILGSKFTK